MSFLELDRVSFAHSGAVPLFEDLSLRLEPGWTGVVGANGSIVGHVCRRYLRPRTTLY